MKKIYYLEKSDDQFLAISSPYYNTDVSLLMADGKNKKELKGSIDKQIINFIDSENYFRSYSLLYVPHYLELSKRLVRVSDSQNRIEKKSDIMKKNLKKI